MAPSLTRTISPKMLLTRNELFREHVALALSQRYLQARGAPAEMQAQHPFTELLELRLEEGLRGVREALARFIGYAVDESVLCGQERSRERFDKALPGFADNWRLAAEGAARTRVLGHDTALRVPRSVVQVLFRVVDGVKLPKRVLCAVRIDNKDTRDRLANAETVLDVLNALRECQKYNERTDHGLGRGARSALQKRAPTEAAGTEAGLTTSEQAGSDADEVTSKPCGALSAEKEAAPSETGDAGPDTATSETDDGELEAAASETSGTEEGAGQKNSAPVSSKCASRRVKRASIEAEGSREKHCKRKRRKLATGAARQHDANPSVGIAAAAASQREMAAADEEREMLLTRLTADLAAARAERDALQEHLHAEEAASKAERDATSSCASYVGSSASLERGDCFGLYPLARPRRPQPQT